MAIENVREYLKQWGKDKDVLEFETSSATVELAAQALGVEPARIAKTLSFRNGEGAMLIVAAGDAKTDNGKYKEEFGFKARMLTPEEALEYTGHAVGGVCPFGLKGNVPVFLDVSLKRFETVFPACGSSNSAIQLTCEELEEYSRNQKWVSVCKGWGEE
jgi:prolyl-tRNA editing enzyme YbaK/EbsC (Cys-tRNA(Pro) deacylase)